MVHDAFFNTFRRSKGQIFYWLPPLVAGYYLMEWATERYVANWCQRLCITVLTWNSNHYLQSKAGRAEFADEAE